MILICLVLVEIVDFLGIE